MLLLVLLQAVVKAEIYRLGATISAAIIAIKHLTVSANWFSGY